MQSGARPEEISQKPPTYHKLIQITLATDKKDTLAEGLSRKRPGLST